MSAFVLEIGTEELPARFLSPVEKELAEKFSAALMDKGVPFAGLTVSSTPRRIVLFISDLAAVSTQREEVVTGPPAKIAYDVGGRPTPSAEGFAKSQGVNLEETFVLETEKGAYLAARKVMGGEDTVDILAEICPMIINSLSFPKRMHWGGSPYTFGRPIRWLLALMDDQVTPFTVGTVDSGNLTYGHRVHGPGPFAVPAADRYFSIIRDKGHVISHSGERRDIIRNGGNALAATQNGCILWKESLLDEVQGLCEYPVPLLGGFDPSFLEVPREVLLTSMENHQKSFGLEDAEGRLLPYFLTVLNITPVDEGLVRRGWERVLRARLEDARFFWKADLASTFDDWLNALDAVIYLAPLGSMGEKTRRISSLCAWLAVNAGLRDGAEAITPEAAARAGRLSKADLVSEMVKEFDTLQGVMGGIYALRAGEDRAVAEAIAEQYLPAGPDSPVPSTLGGALLSMADKADTLAGSFGLGMIPTGAADPYGLRRAALGIARILEEKGIRIDVMKLFAKAFEGYGPRSWKLPPEQALPKLQEFFTLRLKNHFISKGAETLLVEAVLEADASDVWAAASRLEALACFSKTEDFGQAVLTFKRAANIIRKQGQEQGVVLTGEFNDSLLQDEAEKALAAELKRIDPVFNQLWEAESFTELFNLLWILRPFVDAFFDQVMVMCDNKELRLNRLNLLQSLVERLGRLADFSALQM